MSFEQDIAQIARQEQELRFASFSEEDAWTLGSLMRKAAVERNLPFVIDIRIGNRPLFYTALPGSTPENPDWVRRKVNTVYRFHKSSYRVGREYQLQKKPFDATRGWTPWTMPRRAAASRSISRARALWGRSPFQACRSARTMNSWSRC